MEATTSSLCNIPFTSALPSRSLLFSSNYPMYRGKGFVQEPKPVNTKVLASKRSDANFNGKLVDESMVVLRKRIHEMSMLENQYQPPQHWMGWEKQYKKTNYDVDVCEAVGYLQSKLMETRPGVAFAMVTLLMFSVPTSMAVVLSHVMAMAKVLP